MALHDFRCPSCETRYPDIDVPISVGASHAEILCRACQQDIDQDILCVPIPAIGRMSLFGEFEKVTTQVLDRTRPSGYREETISTLADIRRLERESEVAERNGEGQRMVWRDYSQDHSNQQVHTLMADPSEKPAKTYTNGTPVKIRRGDPVVADHGTVEQAQGGVSPLPEG